MKRNLLLCMIIGLIMAGYLLNKSSIRNVTTKEFEGTDGLVNEYLEPESIGYIVNEYTEPESLYFDSGNLKSAHFADKIYRKFTPQESATLNDFKEALSTSVQEIEEWSYENQETIGNAICPLLYSENIVSCTVEELSAIIQEVGSEAHISEDKNGGMALRMINLSILVGKDDIDLNKEFYTFLQVKIDNQVYVQPIAEMSHDKIEIPTLISDNEGNIFLIVEGVRQTNRYGYSYVIFTFSFNGEVWTPCSPQLIDSSYIDMILNKYENIQIRKEGFLALECRTRD